MSDEPAYMDFERPPAAPNGGNAAADTGTHPWDDKPDVVPIPILPAKDLEPVGDGVRGGISDKARAATNAKLDGMSYQEIADLLEYKDAAAAKKDVERALALTHSPDDWETLRAIAAQRAENRLRLSTAMAGASWLVDKNDPDKVLPNVDQIRWHQQAGVDLMNWATITGAKAPAKIEFTPDAEKMDELVNKMLAMSGHEEIMEAEVLELDVVETPVIVEGLDDDDE